ncbi:cytochrome P450 [Zopfochytrium polystomum]|nr:cytochrome P450 [Zopfochytrium polystomum]
MDSRSSHTTLVVAAAAATVALIAASTYYIADASSKRAKARAAAAAQAEATKSDLERYGNSFPVAPGAQPVVGHVPFANYSDLIASLGNAFNVSYFGQPELSISGAENLKWVGMKGDHRFLIPAWPERWNRLLGKHSTALANAYPALHAHAFATLKRLAAASQQGTVEVNPHAFSQEFTFRVICGLVAGAHPAHEAALFGCYPDYQTWSAGWSDLVQPEWWYFTPFALAMRKRAAIAKVVVGIVRERRKMMESGVKLGDGLGCILEARDEKGGQISEEEVSDNVITMLFAGYDTTSNALTTLLHVLTALLPHAHLATLRAEIASLPAQPTEAQLNALPHLDAVYKELLRCYNPVTAFFRLATSDAELGGQAVPKGTTLHVSLFGTMRDPRVYREPEAFDVGRWLEGGEAAGAGSAGAAAWAPFSVGPRMCLGFQLARMEIKVFTFQLLRHFDIQAGAQPAQPQLWPFHTIVPSLLLKNAALKVGRAVGAGRAGGPITLRAIAVTRHPTDAFQQSSTATTTAGTSSSGSSGESWRYRGWSTGCTVRSRGSRKDCHSSNTESNMNNDNNSTTATNDDGSYSAGCFGCSPAEPSSAPPEELLSLSVPDLDHVPSDFVLRLVGASRRLRAIHIGGSTARVGNEGLTDRMLEAIGVQCDALSWIRIQLVCRFSATLVGIEIAGVTGDWSAASDLLSGAILGSTPLFGLPIPRLFAPRTISSSCPLPQSAIGPTSLLIPQKSAKAAAAAASVATVFSLCPRLALLHLATTEDARIAASLIATFTPLQSVRRLTLRGVASDTAEGPATEEEGRVLLAEDHSVEGDDEENEYESSSPARSRSLMPALVEVHDPEDSSVGAAGDMLVDPQTDETASIGTSSVPELCPIFPGSPSWSSTTCLEAAPAPATTPSFEYVAAAPRCKVICGADDAVSGATGIVTTAIRVGWRGSRAGFCEIL